MIKRLSVTGLLLALVLLVFSAAQAATLTLPPKITVIEEEAFSGDGSLDEVVLPDGLRMIGKRAFAFSSLRRITIRASVSYIAPNAFAGVEDLTVVAAENSYAVSYCSLLGIGYVNPVGSVTLDRTELVLASGETIRLTATVLPEKAETRTVSWITSDASVATVSPEGEVTGMGAGTAVITARADGDKDICAECAVTVNGGSLSVSPSKFDTVPPAGGAFSVTVEAGYGTWTCQTGASWISVSQITGAGPGQVTLNVAENTLSSIRTASVVFTSANRSETVTVVQHPYILFVAPDSFGTVSASGGTVETSVSSGLGSWTASCSASWITLSRTGSSGNGTPVTITAAENTSAAPRSANVVFTSGNLEKNIAVYQERASGQYGFSVSPDTFETVDAGGGTLTAVVSSGSSVWTASTGVSWISLSRFSGSGNGTVVTLSVAGNSSPYQRTANVVFNCGNHSKSFTVVQNGASGFTVSPDSFDTVAASGGNLTLTVSSGTSSWSASADATWLSLSKYSGSGTGNAVTVYISANTASSARSAKILFLCGNQSKEITIIQAGTGYSSGGVTALSVSQQGSKYIGTPYSVYDCQAFVEKCLSDAGLHVDLAGSNAWYREMTWRGSPEQCVATFGYIPKGAFLFIVAHDGKEPPKYYFDGLGNASHIGIYTGTGLGAIHSSFTKQGVYESYFACATINGGWNMVGLWKELDYGDAFINQFLANQ